MTAETLVLLALGVPFLGGLSVLFSGPGSANVRDGLTVITSIILFCIVWQLIQIVDAGGRPTVTLLQMIPGLSLTLSLEPLGMIFAGVASFLWIVTSFYAFGYMRGHHEANQTRFFFCFAIAIMSALGIAFSGNMLTLFVFYEVLTISTFRACDTLRDRRSSPCRPGLSGDFAGYVCDILAHRDDLDIRRSRHPRLPERRHS